MSWADYDRPARIPSVPFAAMLATYVGWLSAAEELTPTKAWALRQAMGIPALDGHNPRPMLAQVIKVIGLEHRHTGAGASPHPDYDKWQLDQDRRCKGGCEGLRD